MNFLKKIIASAVVFFFITDTVKSKSVEFEGVISPRVSKTEGEMTIKSLIESQLYNTGRVTAPVDVHPNIKVLPRAKFAYRVCVRGSNYEVTELWCVSSIEEMEKKIAQRDNSDPAFRKLPSFSDISERDRQSSDMLIREVVPESIVPSPIPIEEPVVDSNKIEIRPALDYIEPTTEKNKQQEPVPIVPPTVAQPAIPNPVAPVIPTAVPPIPPTPKTLSTSLDSKIQERDVLNMWVECLSIPVLIFAMLIALLCFHKFVERQMLLEKIRERKTPKQKSYLKEELPPYQTVVDARMRRILQQQKAG